MMSNKMLFSVQIKRFCGHFYEAVKTLGHHKLWWLQLMNRSFNRDSLNLMLKKKQPFCWCISLVTYNFLHEWNRQEKYVIIIKCMHAYVWIWVLLCLFHLLFISKGGCSDSLEGSILKWWFSSTTRRLSTLFFIFLYALSVLLKAAWNDSAPSPIQPHPTLHLFTHCSRWSSNKGWR